MGGLLVVFRKDTDSQDLALERLGVDGLPGGLKQLPQPVYPHCSPSDSLDNINTKIRL